MTYSAKISFLLKQLPNSTRARLVFVLLLGFIVTFAEVLNVGAVVPLIAVLLQPDLIITNDYYLHYVQPYVGSDVRNLQFVITAIFCVATFISIILRQLLLLAQSSTAALAGNNLAEITYTNILTQPYSFFINASKSNIQASIYSYVDNVVMNVISPLLGGFNAFMTLLVLSLTILLISSANILVGAVVLIAAYLFVVLGLRTILRKQSRIYSENQSKIVKILQESIDGIRDIILKDAQYSYQKELVRFDKLKRNATAIIYFLGGSPRIIIEGVFLIGLSISAYQASLSPGKLQELFPILGALIFAAQRMLPLCQTIYASITSILGARSALENLQVYLELKTSSDLTPTRRLPFDNAIEINNLNFSYPKRKEPVFLNSSLYILKGETVAFVGESGAGKSTLLDIVSGLIEVPETLKVDETNISAANAKEWRLNIAYLSQFTFIINGSIEQNITFGSTKEDSNTRLSVEEVAFQANILEFIDHLEFGFDTKLGEGGITLSGGQAQRLGIARTLFQNRSVLIFDESTSALDEQTEKIVISNIQKYHKDKTLLISSHRPEILEFCDKIYKVQDSQINLSK